MEVCIIDYDDYSGDDTKQKFNKGDMIIEIEGEEITNISIYGEPQNNKKDLKIPDKIYEHSLFLYAFKGNKLLCKKLLGQYNAMREEYYDGEYGLLEFAADRYDDDDDEYDDECDDEYDDDDDDEYDDECNDDNYAEEVRRYELNRSYRNYDEYCDYASNDSEDFDYQYSEDNGYDPY